MTAPVIGKTAVSWGPAKRARIPVFEKSTQIQKRDLVYQSFDLVHKVSFFLIMALKISMFSLLNSTS